MHGKRKAKLSKFEFDDDHRIDQVCGNQTRALMKIISDGLHPEDSRSRDLGQMVSNPSLDVFRLNAYSSCRDAISNFVGEEGLLVEKSRLARAAPAAKTQPAFDRDSFLKYNTIISHLVNAIYLQSGLIEGKIPVDEVAGELLGFGSVKASDIANFKPDKVITLLNKLKEVGKTLSDGSNDKMEDETLEWNRLTKEHESMGDDPQMPGKDQYFKDIASWKTASSHFTNIETQLGTYLSYLTNMENAGTLFNTLSQVGLDTALKTLPSFGEIISKSRDDFKSAVNSEFYNSLKNGQQTFAKLETKMKIMSTRGDATPGSNSQNTDVVKKSIGAVAGAVDLFKTSKQEMMLIDGLVWQKMNSAGVKTKKYTDGFPNGISGLKQLSKDVADPWLSDIVGVDRSKLSKLTDGLHPLSKLGDKLGTADEKLKPISSPNVHQSWIRFSELQNAISQFSPDTMDSVEVYNGYEKCKQKNQSVCQTSNDFLSNVKLLAQLLPTVITTAEELNVQELDKEISNFINSLGPQDDLKAVADKVKNNSDLKNLKKRLTQVKEKFNFKKIEDLVAKIEAGDGSNEALCTTAWDIQKKIQKCLQGRTDFFSKAEKLSQSIQVIREIRGFDANKYQDVELAASTISQVSQLFPTIRSMQETMEKDVKNVTTEINELPDSDKKSKTIGQSVSSLQYAFGLKDLEKSLAQLQNVGPVVEAEFGSIKDSSDRTKVGGQWGDHKKHMAELEATLAKIKAFEDRIDVSNASTIGDYGSPLKNLALIPTANINAPDKLKALDVLISTADPKNKDALEEAKKTLEKIASLDLNFSNHHGQFQTAPASFQAFHDFLVDFLSTVQEKKQNEGSSSNFAKADNKPKAAGLAVWEIALICLGALGIAFLLIGGPIALCDFKKKQKEKREQRKAQDERDAAQRAKEEQQRVREEEQRVREEEQRRRLQELEDQNNQAIRDRNAARDAEEDANRRREAAENEERNAQRQRDDAVAQRQNAEQRVAAMNAKNKKARNARADLENKKREEAKAHLEVLKQEITQWIIAQKFADEAKAIEITKYNMRSIFLCTSVDIEASNEFLGLQKHRYQNEIPCKVDTAVRFTTKAGNREVRVHANYVDSKSHKKKYIATQAPIEITFEDFWLMVLEHKTEYIVMLCQPSEKEEGRYDEYFDPREEKEKDCGDITVKTLKTTEVLGGLAREWNFKVVDKKYGYKSQSVTLFQHLEWPDKSVPSDLEKTCQLMDMVEKSEKPVVVHCSAGIGRTVTFIGLDVIMEEVENCTTLVALQAVKTLRNFRAMGVQSGAQLVWLLIGVACRLSKKYLVDTKYYQEQFEFFKKIREPLLSMDKKVAAKNKEDKKADAAKKDAAKKKKNIENNRVDAGTEEDVSVPLENENAGETIQPMTLDKIDEEMAQLGFSCLDIDPDAKAFSVLRDLVTVPSRSLKEYQDAYDATVALAIAEQIDAPAGGQGDEPEGGEAVEVDQAADDDEEGVNEDQIVQE